MSSRRCRHLLKKSSETLTQAPLEQHGKAPRIAPVDWELAGPGPFALDLAALVSGWGSDERLAICEAFHRSLPEARRESIPVGALNDAVGVCELALALQWTGWSRGWEAPPDHRRDWPREAERLLEEVGL